MRILGISLGHDSNFALIENGQIKAVMEAERYFRQKRYKLSAQTLEDRKLLSTYQYTDIKDLRLFLNLIIKEWGNQFDAIAVQNQGRTKEYQNLIKFLKENGFAFKNAHHINHHLSHASLSYFTSPFNEALILSYDGIGNDGKTVFFKGSGNKIEYLSNVPIAFGQSYNNLGYICGIKPEIEGTTSGKLMGLAAYGQVKESWIPYARKYVRRYKKLPVSKLDGPDTYGAGHNMNSVYLQDIPELKKYLVKRERPLQIKSFTDKIKLFFCIVSQSELKLPGPDNKDAQDLAATVQHVWTQEVMQLIKKNKKNFKNICVVGGCALNGITNYVIEKSKEFEKVHLIPNPSDCGLAAGAALYVYYSTLKNDFNGLSSYYSPYLGSLPYDRDDLNKLKEIYPNKEVGWSSLPKILAQLVNKNLIIGLIQGRYEVGPRALGNRSILCNPLNKDMREILNDKVKHREWYRPFAPIVTEKDSQKYFTNTDPIPYMSVICYTRDEYRDRLPSITHVDGSARIQTINKEQNPLLYESLKEFEKISGFPIYLNTSFNPAGEPILNYYSVGLEMLKNTDLDLVIINNIIFCKPGRERKLLENI